MTENAKAEPNIKMLASSKSSDPLAAIIVKIQKAQMILSESDDDGMRSELTETVLKSALASLTEVYEKYRTRRKSRMGSS
jgi:hypothetical protein